ncbi:MAG: zinc-dependent metalloprotease [Flavipsychrobacter sp.]|nr:zinc-dependent metalloprotease [Flavipsychrobacter sp.]
MKFYAKLAALMCFVCCIQANAKAKSEPGYALSGDVKNAKSQGVEFRMFNLFSVTTGAKHGVLSAETLLLPNTGEIKRLYESYPQAVSLTLQTDAGKTFVLDLLQSSPLATNPDMGYIDANGRHQAGYEKAAHYQGAVRGEDKSMAAVSVFANGEVMILFANADGNYVLGKLEDNSGRYILYNDKDFTVKPQNQCGVDDYAAYDKGIDENTGNKTTAAYECKKLSIYWEADFDLYKNKVWNVTLTQNYLTGLFNNVQALYRNEQIAVELKSVYIWTTHDAYDSTSSGVALSDFRSTWNAKSNSFEGDLAMLIALDDGGLGGVAYLDVMCNRSTAYAYGDVNGSYTTIPTYSWDVMMVTHEHGHNIGSRHTHWCGWMTGAGATCGSIDDCTTKENSTGCSNCTYEQFQNSQPVSAWQGSIMSYCHLVSRGVSLANGFGPLPGNKIRTEIANASCLKSIISATLTETAICKGTGAISLTYDTATIGTRNFGAAPFTYAWSNGGTTQNLSGLSTAGAYTVTITDSNGCSNQYSINLTQNTHDSCANNNTSNVGMTSQQPQYVSLYPNPAQQRFTVRFYTKGKSDITLKATDVVGKTTYSNVVPAQSGENNITIDINGWNKGIYFIMLQSADEQYEAVKLIVE